jgi:hypothetical protein
MVSVLERRTVIEYLLIGQQQLVHVRDLQHKGHTAIWGLAWPRLLLLPADFCGSVSGVNYCK